ncbi:hypothetical protein A9Q81_11980 [Gammaproteobacteria bacterium 42_54_T18]|nr:hypothetical protein A9Q81_11980 [Gammaproteobacteria bacterium 42_54_T18]
MSLMKGYKKMANGNKMNTSTLKKKLTTYLTVFLMFFYQVGPVYAALLPSLMIQDELESNPQFERSTSSSYQYQAAAYAEQLDLAATTTEGFYEILGQDYPTGLGEATYVPIAVGDITLILPIYKKYKYVGTPYVQNQYIRGQISNLLGRNLIQPYQTETVQLNALYANALTYVKNTAGAIFGQNLELDQDASGLDYDMVWPEARIINGEEVVVPIVYLTAATVEYQQVTTNVVEVGGDASLGDLDIDGVTIKFGRDSFLQVAKDLLNDGGEIISEGDLDIVVGGSLTNLSGVIQAENSLSIQADGSVENLSGVIRSGNNINIFAANVINKTVVHRYDTQYWSGTRYGEISSIDAENGNLTIRSYNDIVFGGAQASAGGELTLAAGGNISLGSVELYEHSITRFGDGTKETSITSFLQSGLTATETIQLIANGKIVIDAAKIVSDKGHIELLAGLGITIEDDLQVTESHAEGEFGSKDVTESVYQTVAIRALLDAGKGIRLHSQFGDITLRATDITSVEGTTVKATNGGVNMLMTTETDHYSYSSVKSGAFTISTKNYGHNIETGVPNTIVGGFSVEALSGVRVEYEGDSDLSLEEQIGVLSEMEGLEWMGDVLEQAELDPEAYQWNEILLQHETWKESNTSLSPAFMAVIAIAIAIVAGPAGAAMASSVTGAATSAIIAGTAGPLAAAISAGTVALISQATVAVANGAVNGDISGAMKDFASEDTLKSLAVSMVTAGAINSLDTAYFGIDTEAVNELLEFGPATPEMIKAAGTQSLGSQIAQATIHASVKAGVNTVITGGDFEEAFVQSLTQDAVNAIGKTLANEIKDAYKPDPITGLRDINNLTRYIAHAATGCLTGTISSDTEAGCVAGAGGAVIGEAIADVYKDNLNVVQLNEGGEAASEWVKENLDVDSPLELSTTELDEKIAALTQKGVDLARLGAALGAFVAGAKAEEIYIAANAGQNAAANNSLAEIREEIDRGILMIKKLDFYRQYLGLDKTNGEWIWINSWVYGNMDEKLSLLEGNHIQTDWFAAASLVTEFFGLGALDLQGSITVMATGASPSESCICESLESADQARQLMRYISFNLAKDNQITFETLLSGDEIPGYEELTGDDLDYALVEKEQKKVTQYMNEFFVLHPSYDSGELVNLLSNQFDPEGDFMGSNASYLLNNSKVKLAIEEVFTANGIKMDMGIEEHRIKLGNHLVNQINEDRYGQ